MFGIFAFLTTCLAWSLLLKPGYAPKLDLQRDGNFIQVLCQEMDGPSSAEDLTQLSEACLVTLHLKRAGELEYCSKSYKCVKQFHLYSTFYNKSYGDANVRPYLIY